MKTKKGSKPRKPSIRRKAKSKARPSTRTRSHPKTTIPVASSESLPKFKTCEEVEVGDIGGFGSPEELESHENRCRQPASQLCNTCGRNLCGTHYDLLHRDHDSGTRQDTSAGLTRV